MFQHSVVWNNSAPRRQTLLHVPLVPSSKKPLVCGRLSVLVNMVTICTPNGKQVTDMLYATAAGVSMW
jgi:hypothetical protein